MRDFQALEVATQQTFAKRKNAVLGFLLRGGLG